MRNHLQSSTAAEAQGASDGEELITTQQLSREIHTHEKTIIRWRSSGEGPAYVRIGRGRVLYRRRDVAAWLAARTHQHHAAELAKQAA